MKKQISGIYAIVNKVNGKRYIGSSKHVGYRWNQSHRPQLRNNKHYNSHLQNAWNKYGEESFNHIVIEECAESLLEIREGHWIEFHKSWHRDEGYNLVRFVEGRMVRYDYEKHNTIMKLFKKGMSKNKIACELKVSRSMIYSCLEQNGLHENTGAGSEIKLTDEVKQQIVDLRSEGKSWDEITQNVPVSKTQLHRTKTILPDGKYQTDKVNRKAYRTITPEVIEKAQELRRNTKMTWQEIAKECEVSREWLSSSGACKGFEPRRGFMTEEKWEKAQKLRGQGLDWTKIAIKLEVSPPTLRRWRNNL